MLKDFICQQNLKLSLTQKKINMSKHLDQNTIQTHTEYKNKIKKKRVKLCFEKKLNLIFKILRYLI